MGRKRRALVQMKQMGVTFEPPFTGEPLGPAFSLGQAAASLDMSLEQAEMAVGQLINEGIARRSGDSIVLLDNAANAEMAWQVGVGQGESPSDLVRKLKMIANPVFKAEQ